MNRAHRTRLLTTVAAGIAAVLTFAPQVGAQEPNPLQGKRIFMDCEAGRHPGPGKYDPWYALRRNPRHENLLRKIAEVPAAKWFAGVNEPPTRVVERFFAYVDDPQHGGPSCSTPLARGARDAYVGDYPVIVIRRLVKGSCAGMKTVGNEYKAWIDEFIRMSQLTYVPNSLLPSGLIPGLTLPPLVSAPHVFDEDERYQYWMGKPFPRGRWVKHPKREMTIILEPDALGLMGSRRSCLRRSQVPGKLALLAYAAERLGSTPGMNVYIDAGSSSWLKRGKVTRYLRRAGVRHVRGFSVNTMHFNRTRKERRFGDAIARSLGKHYVLNTSQNANGPLPKRLRGKYGSMATNCNPRNAGLGIQPTTNTGTPYADAFLWISRPGLSSNGKAGNLQCGPENGPPGNIFYLKHALRLAKQASFSQAAWPPRPL